MEDNGDEPDWPDDSEVGRSLSTLQESLFCPICYDWFTNPQMLKCGHTFCSICIRKHMDPQINRTSSSTCAVCREAADSFDLRKNTVVCDAVQCFRGMRTGLIDLLRNRATKANLDDDCIEIVELRPKNISAIANGLAITKRLAHFSFHGMKREKVKATLVQLSGESRVKLRVDGEKETMEKRVREFVHLHNAQIGSARPLSLEQVIRAVNDNETQLDRESSKSARTVNKFEKVKNGEVVKEVEDNFARLTQKIKEQKAAALRKLESSKSSAASSEPHAAPTVGSPRSGEAAHASPVVIDKGSGTSVLSSSEDAGRAAGRWSDCRGGGGAQGEEGVEQSAALVCSLEQLLRRGYDWGPWRVVMSRKLARPFFFNTTTGVGQFAVPPELQVVIDEEAQAPASAEVVDLEDCEKEALGEPECKEVSKETSQGRRTRSKSSQPLAADAGGATKQPSRATAVNSGSEDDEEESPFHMLVDSQGESQGRFGSRSSGLGDSTRRRMPRASASGIAEVSFSYASASSSSSSSAATGARGGATSHPGTISGATTVAYLPTAMSTAMDLPQPTPYPLGAAAFTSSASTGPGTGTPSHATPGFTGRIEDDDMAAASKAAQQDAGRRSGGAVGGIGFEASASSQIPGLFAVRSGDAAAAASTEWSCGTCTYLNGFHTYSCEMCGAVDKAVQSRFSKPLLRSSAPASQHSSGAKKKFSPGSAHNSGSSKKARR